MKNKLIFLALFVVLGFALSQLPVNKLAGTKAQLTFFDMYYPVSGAFLGSWFGVIAVLAMQIGNLVIHGFNGVDSHSVLRLIATLRFLPLIFGTLYFSFDKHNSKLSKLILLAPLAAIISFNLNPIGRSVWYYSLFWTIPLLVWPLRQKFLLARSLGSTFTAHAVGGAVWIWAFHLPAVVWVGLVPVVILERTVFALGMSASYILLNNVLGYLEAKKLLPSGLVLNKKYLLK